MKKILPIALLCALAYNSKAQNIFPLPSGWVGIGITTPTYPLTLNNAAGETGILTINNGTSIYLAHGGWGMPAGKFGIGNGSVPTFVVNAVANGGASVGNVGIGTTSPDGMLTINGPLSSGASLTFGVPGDYGNTSVPVGSTTGGYNIDFHTWRDVVPNQIGARIRAERINNFSENNALVQSMDLAFYTALGSGADLTEKLRIKSDGNVGIGISNPQEKLAVNGTIHSKKVVVDLINWPDYVFKPTYNLKPLSEVKSYIDLNHHLPEMPSEKEVAEKGVDLGEMNKLLTKKVEELTLYLIKQQKQIDEIKKTVQYRTVSKKHVHRYHNYHPA